MKDAANTYAVFVSGPRWGRARVRRAQAELLARVIVVAGAGMAGLCAGARLRQLGVDARILEKGDRPGGSMRLSSGFVWRYRTYELFREQCPDGDPALQLLLQERLDAALDWLEELGAPVKASETGNPLTAGRAFDPRGLTHALVAAIGGVELGAPLAEEPAPLVLATGGFGGNRALVEEHIAPGGTAPGAREPLVDGRRPPAGAGARGGAPRAGLDEFYGRALPAVTRSTRDDVRRRRAALRAVRARRRPRRRPARRRPVLVGARPRPGDRPPARGTGAGTSSTAPFSRTRVRERTVADMVAARWSRCAGTPRRLSDELAAALGFPLEAAPLFTPPFAAVQVEASITHTIGGLAIDERGARPRRGGGADPGLYAAGVDAGGFSGGGYASGLAQALVTGLGAAESAARYSGSV